MAKLYNKDSIESLEPLQFTRLKPSVYAGDCTYSTQLLIEIFSNAIDEIKAGHGDKINVTIKGDEITVEDFGQGFLINSKREDGETILQAAFDVLNTSGKFREDGTYEGVSLGSYGIGSKITNFLSHWLRVVTWRDGKYEDIRFEEGVFKTRDVGKTTHNSGTEVTWKPSEEFFVHTEVEIAKVRDLFKTTASLCPGLTIHLDYNGKKEVFFSEKGIDDLIDYYVKDNELIHNRLNISSKDGKYQLDLVLTYTSNYTFNMIPYVNTGLTDSGPHITLIKTALTREFNTFFREKEWLKEKDENLNGDDIQEGLFIVFNYTSPSVRYDAQVKSRVTEIECKPLLTSLVESLNVWMQYNDKEVKLIFDKAIAARKVREATKKARDAAREKEKAKAKPKFNSKLAECYSKERDKCEIYITEGDSASGNLKTARNNEFQAVMPVRGKILNCQKATFQQMQKNQEIMTMIEAFGLELDLKNMKIKYEPDKLRYGKIIILSDADVDGSHIKNLFYTFIWNFCPDLIKDGYVYAGVPPLYKVTIGKDKKEFLKDDDALDKFRLEHKDEKYIVQRLKGLGEMNVNDTEILVDPEQRIIKKISVDDITAANMMFENLMGEGAAARKIYIQQHSKEATYDV